MRFLTLYSGSGGNSTLVEAAGARILIDAGKCLKTLSSSLLSVGVSVSEIDAIFITHEHSDHTSALETLSKKYNIPIHITDKSAEKFNSDRYGALCQRLVIHPQCFELEVGGLKISSFPTPHDSRMSVGYKIEFFEDGKAHSWGYATDIGYVTKTIAAALEGCEAVVLESNHDIEMLKAGPYPYDLKQRILSRRGHLSNAESSLFAAHLATKGTKSFILAHLSEENNRPDIALDEFLSATADKKISVAIAHPDDITEMPMEN